MGNQPTSGSGDKSNRGLNPQHLGAKRKVVVVLGMHRSGTSVLTGTLGLLGAGMPREPIPAADENQTGYWEPGSIGTVHDALFAELGLGWSLPFVDPASARNVLDQLGSETKIAHWVEKLVECVENEYDPAPVIVIKDPRMCRLMPLWLRVFEELDLEPSFVIPIRHPAEVIGSLKARDSFDAGRSMWLWMDHVLRAEHDTRGMTRVVVEYSQLLTNWRTTMTRINDALGLDLQIEQRGDEVDRFISARYQHHKARTTDHQTLPNVVGDALGLFEQAAASTQGIDTDGFDHVSEAFDEVRQLSAQWLIDTEHRADDAHTHNQTLVAQAQVVQSKLDKSVRQAETTNTQYTAKIAAGQAILQSLRQTNRTLAKELKHTESKLLLQTQRFSKQLGEQAGEHKESVRNSKAQAAKLEKLEKQIKAMNIEHQTMLDQARDLEEALSQASADAQHARDSAKAQAQIESNAREQVEKHAQALAQEAAVRFESQDVQLKLNKHAHEVRQAQQEHDQIILAEQIRELNKRTVSPWRIPMKLAMSFVRWPSRHSRRLTEDVRLVSASSLFDAQWYIAKYPDVAAAGANPAMHYVGQGCTEGREPSQWFDAAWYLETHRDVAASGLNPLVHYLRTGWLEKRAIRQAYLAPATEDAPANQRPAESSNGSSLSQVLVDIRDRSSADFPLVEVDPVQRAKTTAVAFYLPQFHPIPENDQWWGKGFTEWRNVVRAKAQFGGHDQPIVPGELGYYDLRLPEVRQHQAQLAQKHGIGAFCYHYYWFNGRRVLERPLNDLLSSDKPSMPFCICWANENWTRRWDGLEQEVLLHQKHTLQSDRQFFLDLIPTLEDKRYLRVDGKPVIVVYRADLMANAQDTAAVWRDEARRAGLGDIHLCAVRFRTDDPRPLGFDAAIEFPPHHFPAPEITHKVTNLDPAFDGRVLDWATGAAELIRNPIKADYRLYRCVNPGWDNTARRMSSASIFTGATPLRYEAWLRSAINQRQPDDGVHDNLVFINAWNEWAEGAVLEPTSTCNMGMLKATARAMGLEPSIAAEPIDESASESSISNGIVKSDVVIEASPVKEDPVLTDRLKRFVRRNQTLNTIACRQPKLAQSVLRAIETVQPTHSKPASNGHVEAAIVEDSPQVQWRDSGRNQTGTRTPAVFVSHDAARAGSQLLLLEIVRHVAAKGQYEPYVILLGGGELEPEFCKVARCITITDEVSKFGSTQAALEGVVRSIAPLDPAFAICASVVSSPAAQALSAQNIPVLTLINELVTSMEAYGTENVRNAVDASQRCVCVSNFSRTAMINAFDLDKDKVNVVYPGYLPHNSTPLNDSKASAKFRAKHGIPQNAKLVLGCGTVHPRKGPDLFIRLAAKHLASNELCNTWFVWIGAGDPADMRWARHDVESAGIEDRCLFVGQLPEVGSAFEACDVFALTSREDPFPLVGLEALSRGVPMLCFDGAGGAPEIVEEDAGAIVPYLDIEAMEKALDHLLTDDSAYASASLAARTKAHERTHFNYYMDQLHSLIEGMTQAAHL